MTESTQDRTARGLASNLGSYEWTYQYSCFCVDTEDCSNLLENLPRFKKEISRVFHDSGMLVCLRTLKSDWAGLQAYVVVFSTSKLKFKELKAIANKFFKCPINLINKRLSEEKRASTIRAIKKQKPHNLKAFFGKNKVNRYALLNKKYLVPQGYLADSDDQVI